MNTNCPDVTIIVTNYNYAKYLDRCLRSCLKQENINCQVILVDDCSTDNTEEVILPFKNKITFLKTEKNSGVAAASNLGIDYAMGRFIIRVDADDFIHEDTCYFLMRYLQMNRDAFCVSCDYYLVDDYENKLERKYAAKDNISCGVMYRKELFKKLGCYNENMRHCEEEELRKRIGKFYNIHHLSMPFYRYRMHDSNKTKNPEYAKVLKRVKEGS
jgi:glycosyltransferase involved in cell wall biosynthesis